MRILIFILFRFLCFHSSSYSLSIVPMGKKNYYALNINGYGINHLINCSSIDQISFAKVYGPMNVYLYSAAFGTHQVTEDGGAHFAKMMYHRTPALDKLDVAIKWSDAAGRAEVRTVADYQRSYATSLLHSKNLFGLFIMVAVMMFKGQKLASEYAVSAVAENLLAISNLLGCSVSQSAMDAKELLKRSFESGCVQISDEEKGSLNDAVNTIATEVGIEIENSADLVPVLEQIHKEAESFLNQIVSFLDDAGADV